MWPDAVLQSASRLFFTKLIFCKRNSSAQQCNLHGPRISFILLGMQSLDNSGARHSIWTGSAPVSISFEHLWRQAACVPLSPGPARNISGDPTGFTKPSSRCAPETLYGASKDAVRRILMAYADIAPLSLAWGRILLPLWSRREKRPARQRCHLRPSLRSGISDEPWPAAAGFHACLRRRKRFCRAPWTKAPGCHSEGAVTFDKRRFLSKVWPCPCLDRLENRPKSDLAAGDTTVGSRPSGPQRLDY